MLGCGVAVPSTPRAHSSHASWPVLDGTDFIRRFDIPQIQFGARDVHQFFGGPREIRLNCLSEFFFHRLLQFGDNSLNVFPLCAFAGVGDEARAIGIASDPCCLYRRDAGR